MADNPTMRALTILCLALVACGDTYYQTTVQPAPIEDAATSEPEPEPDISEPDATTDSAPDTPGATDVTPDAPPDAPEPPPDATPDTTEHDAPEPPPDAAVDAPDDAPDDATDDAPCECSVTEYVWSTIVPEPEVHTEFFRAECPAGAHTVRETNAPDCKCGCNPGQGCYYRSLASWDGDTWRCARLKTPVGGTCEVEFWCVGAWCSESGEPCLTAE